MQVIYAISKFHFFYLNRIYTDVFIYIYICIYLIYIYTTITTVNKNESNNIFKNLVEKVIFNLKLRRFI